MSFKSVACLLGLSLMLVLTATPGLAQRGGGFDGTWTVKRSFTVNEGGPGCGPIGSEFRIRIKGHVVTAPGGRGSVSPSGAIRFPGVGNYFTGALRGNSGSSTYAGRCGSTFSARRG